MHLRLAISASPVARSLVRRNEQKAAVLSWYDNWETSRARDHRLRVGPIPNITDFCGCCCDVKLLEFELDQYRRRRIRIERIYNEHRDRAIWLWLGPYLNPIKYFIKLNCRNLLNFDSILSHKYAGFQRGNTQRLRHTFTLTYIISNTTVMDSVAPLQT